MRPFGRITTLARRYLRPLRHSTIIDKRKLHAVWEYSHLGRLLPWLGVDCVIDVGANAGQYAQMLRQRVGYKGAIYSFEPHPLAVAEARKKARSDPLWTVFESAIGDKDGTASFNVMRNWEFSSFSSPNNRDYDKLTELNTIQQCIEVRTQTLESAIASLRTTHPFSRPFLKLDTQGYDVRIIESAGNTLQEFVGLQSELAITKLYEDSVDFRKALTLYEEKGFTLSALVPNNAGHFPRLLEIDCIMIRNDLLTC